MTSDTTVKKISGAHSPRGALGQRYLVSGKAVAMRLWDREPADDGGPDTVRDYETVGYVIDGAAELHTEGQVVRQEGG